MPISQYDNAVLEIEHDYIHVGLHYTCQDYDAEVDIASPKYWHVKTTDTDQETHFRLTVRSSFPGLMEFFEAPTLSADGTPLTAFNNDRNSSNTAALSCFSDPTVSADGTRILANVMGTDPVAPGVAVASSDGGIAQRENELLLKKNTSYLVKFTTEINDARVSNCFEWYEPPF